MLKLPNKTVNAVVSNSDSITVINDIPNSRSQCLKLSISEISKWISKMLSVVYVRFKFGSHGQMDKFDKKNPLTVKLLIIRSLCRLRELDHAGFF